MAVYSKDFAKPEDEERCKWYDEPFLRPYPYCHFLRKSCLGLDRCPLVYVPEPHGRLIDADALLNHLEQLLSYCTPGSHCALRVREMMVELETTPTVIPANHGQGPDEA